MNCAHCQNPLPEKYGGVYCPFCGKDLPSADSLRLTGGNSVEQVKLDIKLFFLMFLGPPTLTLISAWLFKTEQAIPVMVGLIGGILGGIIGGSMLSERLAKTQAGRILLTFILSSIMVLVSLTLCGFGCAFGGFNFGRL